GLGRVEGASGKVSARNRTLHGFHHDAGDRLTADDGGRGSDGRGHRRSYARDEANHHLRVGRDLFYVRDVVLEVVDERVVESLALRDAVGEIERRAHRAPHAVEQRSDEGDLLQLVADLARRVADALRHVADGLARRLDGVAHEVAEIEAPEGGVVKALRLPAETHRPLRASMTYSGTSYMIRPSLKSSRACLLSFAASRHATGQAWGPDTSLFSPQDVRKTSYFCLPAFF